MRHTYILSSNEVYCCLDLPDTEAASSLITVWIKDKNEKIRGARSNVLDREEAFLFILSFHFN